MKKETKMMDVYVAEDGKEFANEEDCSKYEDGLKDKANIRYFRVLCNPDLTETGWFTSEIPVAVLSKHGLHSGIVANWCVKKEKDTYHRCWCARVWFSKSFRDTADKRG